MSTLSCGHDSSNLIDVQTGDRCALCDERDALLKSVLRAPMRPSENEAGAKSVREFLIALLAKLWREQESFSGKRPWGNGGWEFAVYRALLEAGLVSGKLDDDGCVERVDFDAADRLIADAIETLR